MARIDVLPSIEIIRGLKGILDFYVWRGLPCVRAWPRYHPTRQTDASLAAALLFGTIIKAYALLANRALLAYRQDALDQPRTARDLMVTGIYGNLHEASMSDFLDLLTQCRDFLSDLTDLLHALDSIDTDELVVNVDQTVLPPLAATTTIQTTQLTALQKIDDLQDALESKALDRLLVRGSDQLFSYLGQYFEPMSHVFAAGGNYNFLGTQVPANEIWLLTTAVMHDDTGAFTEGTVDVHKGASVITLQGAVTVAQWQRIAWSGLHPMIENDRAAAWFRAVGAGHNLYASFGGYKMTLET